MGYDDWLSTNPNDYVGDDNDGCTCPRTLGAGGMRKTDRDCPLHGIDPDNAREEQMDNYDD